MSGVALANALHIPLADNSVQCVVFDPFVGSGTAVEEAIRLRRHGIGLDINAGYLKDLAADRMAVIQPMLT